MNPLAGSRTFRVQSGSVAMVRTSLSMFMRRPHLIILPLLFARTALEIGVVLVATSIAKGLFDGCIYASMHDVIPPHARATAVGMMTMIGFFGAGTTPLIVAGIGEAFGMRAGIVAMAGLYFVAVIILLAMQRSTRRAVLANSHEVHT